MALRGRPQLPQSLTGLGRLVGLRIALDDVLQFLRAFVFLAEFEQGKSFFQLRCSGLIAAGKVFSTKS